MSTEMDRLAAAAATFYAYQWEQRESQSVANGYKTMTPCAQLGQDNRQLWSNYPLPDISAPSHMTESNPRRA